MADLIKLSEADFLRRIIDQAHAQGWIVAHFRSARVLKDGEETWRTPVQADGAGFPDLVLVRGPRLLFVELKSAEGVVSPEQQVWLKALAATKVEVYVFRPGGPEEEIDALLARETNDVAQVVLL